MIRTTRVNKARESFPGSIGKKWGVTGEAVVYEGFECAVVTIQYVASRGHLSRSRLLAGAHELGHVAVAQDYVDGMPSALAWDSYCHMPVFENEVEAWLHGIEMDLSGMIVRQQDVHFILDCLNSYRRGYHATDYQWSQVLYLVADYYTGPSSDVYDYEPLEPETGEEPPSCGTGVVGPAPEDGEDGGSPDSRHEPPRPDDPSRGYEEDDKEDDFPTDEEDDFRNYGDPSGEFDSGWNIQEVLDDLLSGSAPRRVADRYGLDVDRMPPLARAIWGEE